MTTPKNPPAPAKQRHATFRFYGNLNDFLPLRQRQQTLSYGFNGTPGIKDAIEAQGIPHCEVDLIVIDGACMGFEYRLRADQRVAVYPRFESLPPGPDQGLCPPSPNPARFILDVHLGKLARFLRLLGIDCLYRNDLADAEIVNIGVSQKRIILTRDLRLLFAKRVAYGYWVRSQIPERQLSEVMSRFELADQTAPLHRCVHCNGLIESVAKAQVLHLLEPKTKLYYTAFRQCTQCGQVYWKGSHHSALMQWVTHWRGKE